MLLEEIYDSVYLERGLREEVPPELYKTIGEETTTKRMVEDYYMEND